MQQKEKVTDKHQQVISIQFKLQTQSNQYHTAEYLRNCNILNQKKKSQIFCHVDSIVSDNVSNVNRMRKLLEKSGFSAYNLNLLVYILEATNLKDTLGLHDEIFQEQSSELSKAPSRRDVGNILLYFRTLLGFHIQDGHWSRMLQNSRGW